MQIRFSSLKTKMMAATLPIVVAFLLCAAFVTLLYFERQLKIIISGVQATMLSEKAHDIDDKISSIHGALIGVSKVVPSEVLSDPDGAQAWLNNRTGIQFLFGNGIFLFQPSGRLIAEAPFRRNRRGADFSHRAVIRETTAAGKPSISQPYRSSQAHNHPAIMLTAPERAQLKDDIDELSFLLQQVVSEQNMSVRFNDPHLRKCHVEMHCASRDCLCFGKDAQRRWQEVGTYGGKQAQCRYSREFAACDDCPVFKLAVSDTGCGIPPENRGRIFEPFLRPRKSAKARGSASASRTKSSKSMTVKSRSSAKGGKGTTFTLTIPVVEG